MKLAGVSLTMAAVLLAPGIAVGQNTPKTLQTSGVATIERVRNQLRRSGFQPTLLSELTSAKAELESSYRGFRAISNESEAAVSIVGMADSERLASVFTMAAGQGESARQQSTSLAKSARSHYEEGAALARKTGNAAALVRALNGMAMLDESQEHDYGAANFRITEALRAAASCPDQNCLLDSLLSKVEVETYRGELFSAASHVNGVLLLLRDRPDPNRQYSAYLDRSSVYRSMSEGCSYNQQKSVEICLQLFERSKDDALRAANIASKAGMTYNASIAEEEVGQLDELKRVTELYNSMTVQVVESATFKPKTSRDVLVTEIIPPGDLASQDVDAIKAMMQSVGPTMAGSLATWMQAQVDDLEGHADAAMQGYLSAIRMVEEERRKLGEDSARASFLDERVGLYERPIILLIDAKRYSEAFSLLEQSRARATSDLLDTKSAGIFKPADRQMLATLARKKAEITSLQTHFFNATLSPQPDSGEDTSAIAAAQTHLAELEGDYEKTLLRLGGKASGVQNVAVSQPVTLEALQRILREDRTDLLYYFVTDTALVLIHVGPDSFHARNVFLPRLALIRKAAALRASMSKQGAEFRGDVAKELFLYLVQPALPWLSTEHLVIVPHADMVSLPFQALQNPADGSFLGERFQITYAPSATILAGLKRVRNLAGGSILAASDPSLPGASEEVKSLGQLYPNHSKIVTDSLIRKVDLEHWAASYDIVHLAVHGSFDSQEPLLSNVKLAPSGTEGDLTAAEIFGLALERARIVTLSACETGRVRTTRANEIQGIQQALLFAGAQSLLVSAWKVDSEATSLWMRTFYREAQSKSPAEAAREAIRTLRRDSRYSHPFYWAAFLLVAR